MAMEELKKNCSYLDIVNKINNIIRVNNSSFEKIDNRSITIGGVTKSFNDDGEIVFTSEEIVFGEDVEAAKEIHFYNTKAEFPNIGQNEHLYIAEEEDAIYRWLTDSHVYVALNSGSDLQEDISAINGGNAASFSEQ